jgi:hypothetical protein
MNYVLPLAICLMLGTCDRSTGAPTSNARPRNGKIELERAIEILDITSDRFLYRDGVPNPCAFQVNKGDIVVVNVLIRNNGPSRSLSLRLRPFGYPACVLEDGTVALPPRPIIPGGFEVLEQKGIESEIAQGETRLMTFKIKFNANEPQYISFDLMTIGMNEEDLYSKNTFVLCSNQPEDLKMHQDFLNQQAKESLMWKSIKGK